MRDKFTICVLLYGDYPKLTHRCLDSIQRTIATDDLNLRVGSNEIGQATRDYVELLIDGGQLDRSNWYDSTENSKKYPLMRRMLYDPDNLVKTPFIVWFDDDSYLNYQPDPSRPLTWLARLEEAMRDADMVGALYSKKWEGNQPAWIKDQPWYNGDDPALRSGTNFLTGGWWCIRTAILYRYDYPWPALNHRGGDVMLGELCRQQKLRTKVFREGVHINADEAGRESQSAKRGFNEPPIGSLYEPSVACAVHRATTQSPLPLALPRSKPRSFIELDV